MKATQFLTFNGTRLALAMLLAISLAACGGGGGGSSSTTTTGSTTTTTTTTTSTSVAGTVTTAQYTASSVQSEIFTDINNARQECGFSTLQENTILDQSVAAHAQYNANLQTVTDTEVSTNTGYTGATYQTRAEAAGLPSDVQVAGVSASYYTSPALTGTQYGDALAAEWQAGVYHTAIFTWPASLIGVGEALSAYNGVEWPFASVAIANFVSGTASEPIAFPCNGMTNVPYEEGGESPTPPNVSGTWGPAVSVTGRSLSDVIVMTSATIVPTAGGTTLTMQVLDSANDTNKVLPSYEGVAYASVALSPNTQYTYTLNFTVNGVSKTVTNSFTTGSLAG